MIRGELAQNGVPEWEPLRAVAGDEVLDAFMWMHAVRLRDGSPVHAYKHIDTRGYVHLGLDGQGYAYVGEERYRRVEARRLFAGIALDLAQLCPRDDVDFRAMWAVVERLERVVERTTAAELGRASSASRA
jgi:hypothetical protein